MTVSLALAISARGDSIPAFYIFPRKNMQRIFMDRAAPGSVGYATESGLMNAELFIKFMEHFIAQSHASIDEPTILILDSHTSHLSIDVLDMALNNGITMISLPPHCSHRL